MKKITLLTLVLLNVCFCKGQIAINTDGSQAHESSIFDVKSTDKGVLIPRVPAADLVNISNPSTGLLVFNTSLNDFCFFNGTEWAPVGSNALAGKFIDGTDPDDAVYLDGFVGIGTNNPSVLLDVNGVIAASNGNSGNWNDAYSWNNHANAGYLSSEVDGSITNEIITNLNLNGRTLEITEAGNANTIDLSNIQSVFLGEVRMFALSENGAVTKESLQSEGWAICDGTTPSSQGISGASLENTPDLRNRFIRMSNDEGSGNSGGSDDHKHISPFGWEGSSAPASSLIMCTFNGYAVNPWPGLTKYNFSPSTAIVSVNNSGDYTNSAPYTSSESSVPPYYELAFFIKVK